MNNIVYLSLGSNLGDRYSNITLAISYISKKKTIKIISESNIYETEPLYNSKQSNFYNNVIKIKTSLSPQLLLNTCKEIESEMGRVKKYKRNMPRIIDIDIITFNDRIINSKNLKIPHPKLHERKFVLLPFSDIDSKFVFPNKKTLNDLLNILEDSSKIIKLKTHKT